MMNTDTKLSLRKRQQSPVWRRATEYCTDIHFLEPYPVAAVALYPGCDKTPAVYMVLVGMYVMVIFHRDQLTYVRCVLTLNELKDAFFSTNERGFWVKSSLPQPDAKSARFDPYEPLTDWLPSENKEGVPEKLKQCMFCDPRKRKFVFFFENLDIPNSRLEDYDHKVVVRFEVIEASLLGRVDGLHR